MANRFYRARIRERVETARRKFGDAGMLDHPGAKGKAREVAVAEIIQPLLFEHLAIGAGTIVDYLGNQSAETDCIIYSKRFLPTLMISQESGIYPLDATLVALEIKSRLTAEELKDTLQKTRRLWALKYSTYSYIKNHEGETTVRFHVTAPALFAFTSDLTKSGKTELDRYRELDFEADERPQVSTFCVLGRGTWDFDRQQKQWRFYPPTDHHDEMIDFMALLLDTSTITAILRPRPVLSAYLVDHRGFDATGAVIRGTDPMTEGRLDPAD